MTLKNQRLCSCSLTVLDQKRHVFHQFSCPYSKGLVPMQMSGRLPDAFPSYGRGREGKLWASSTTALPWYRSASSTRCRVYGGADGTSAR